MAKGSMIKPALYLVIFALAAGSLLWLLRDRGPAEGAVAAIWVEGEVILSIPLSEAEDREFSITDEAGRDITFQIKEGAIRFSHSDCPDKICINTGFLREDGDIASCLPNQTVLTVTVTVR